MLRRISRARERPVARLVAAGLLAALAACGPSPRFGPIRMVARGDDLYLLAQQGMASEIGRGPSGPLRFAHRTAGTGRWEQGAFAHALRGGSGSRGHPSYRMTVERDGTVVIAVSGGGTTHVARFSGGTFREIAGSPIAADLCGVWTGTDGVARVLVSEALHVLAAEPRRLPLDASAECGDGRDDVFVPTGDAHGVFFGAGRALACTADACTLAADVTAPSLDRGGCSPCGVRSEGLVLPDGTPIVVTLARPAGRTPYLPQLVGPHGAFSLAKDDVQDVGAAVAAGGLVVATKSYHDDLALDVRRVTRLADGSFREEPHVVLARGRIFFDGTIPVAALASGDVVVARETDEQTLTLTTLRADGRTIAEEDLTLGP